MKAWKRGLCLLLAVCLALAGCGRQEQQRQEGVQVWYMNQEETALQYEYRQPLSQTSEGLQKELLEMLRENPADENGKSVLPEKVQILSCTLEQGALYLDLSAAYLELPKYYEVLCRAALVRTLCQLPEVEQVALRVEGSPLLDLDGREIGLMNAGQFTENAGEEINAYKDVTLTLYFANETGDGLVSQSMVIQYNSNLSLEKLIVERLIQGPPFQGAYPSLPHTTKLLSTTVKDDTCYVNLDEGFLDTTCNVTESVPIYSIVNSLVENTSVQKVQISINGETNRTFRSAISLETPFEKNEDLIQ